MPGAHFVLTRVREALVVTLQDAADAETLAAASQALMRELTQGGTRGVIFEVSGCDVVDRDEFVALLKLVQAVEWLGVRSVISGLKPGIAAYLASTDVSTHRVHAVLDLEQALSRFAVTKAAKR
jgi:anti-anti-sigma regulatory factor